MEKGTESYAEFACFESGSGQQVRVYRDIFKGREVLSIRKFYNSETNGWQPGKGVTFHYEDIDDIIGGLEAMKEWLEENTKE